MSRLFALWLILILPYLIVAQSPQKVIIYFSFNKYYITNDAALILENALKANAKKTIDSIKIYTYCDSVGGFSANDKLAIARAAAVKNYLVNNKVGANDFKEIRGFGRRIPANDNSTDSLRSLNRRAEILIFAKEHSFADSIKAILKNLQAGDKFGLRNLNFYGGSHRVLPESIPVLEALLSALKQYPQMQIEIQGYVCCQPEGKDGYDADLRKLGLSVSRAKTIYNYLLLKGIAANRLIYKGYGSHPLVAEVNEDAMAANRRVEIKILKK